MKKRVSNTLDAKSLLTAKYDKPAFAFATAEKNAK
jgi:hypothetical protein